MRGLPSTGSASLYLQYNMIWKKVNPQSPAGGFLFCRGNPLRPLRGHLPQGGGKGRWGPLSPSLAPPVGELSAQLTERAGDGLPRRGFAPPRNDRTGGRKDSALLRGAPHTLPNSTKYAIISSAHGYALALPVFGRREAPLSGGGRNFFPPPLHRRGGDVMVTYSDLFDFGILIVAIISLVLQIKKK